MHRHWEPEPRGVWLLVTKFNVTKGNKLLGTEQMKTRRKKENSNRASMRERFNKSEIQFILLSPRTNRD